MTKRIITVLLALLFLFVSVSARTKRKGRKLPPVGSCVEKCGGHSGSQCWCDDVCEKYNDCCEDKSKICDSIKSEVEFEEDGKPLVQKQSYHHENKEAVLKVPAHKDYDANTFILVGKDSKSPLAGKMMAVMRDWCEIFDKPDGIDVEKLGSETKSKKSQEEKIVYLWKSNHVIIKPGSEEYKDLTGIMKDECKGIPIYKADMEIVDKPKMRSRTRKLKKRTLKHINETSFNYDFLKQPRQGFCKLQDIMVLCNDLPPSGCFRWVYANGEKRHILTLGNNPPGKQCTMCCDKEDTNLLPCSCIVPRNTPNAYKEQRQILSTAYHHLNYHCMPNTAYCKYDPTSTATRDLCNASNHPYTGQGACVCDDSCYGYCQYA